MNSRVGKSIACSMLLVAISSLLSCKREQRQFEPPPSGASNVVMSDLQPGAQRPKTPTQNSFEETAYDLSEGKRLFTQYNCSGCHANGGGSIGPPLMDEKWIYGSDPANIYSTILEGRPNGMPTFRYKIPDSQIWQLSGYVRSLSGQIRKDIAPGRNDDMNAHRSEQRAEEKKPQQSFVPKSAEQP